MCIVEKETDGFWLQMKRRKQRFSFLGILLLSQDLVFFSFSIGFLESNNRGKRWRERDQGSVFSENCACIYLFIVNKDGIQSVSRRSPWGIPLPLHWRICSTYKETQGTQKLRSENGSGKNNYKLNRIELV